LSNSDSFVPRFIGSNIKNFFLGSAQDREVRETKALHDRVRASYARHPLAEREKRSEFVLDVVFEICASRDQFPSHSLLQALCSFVEELVVFEGLADFPETLSIDMLSIEEAVWLRGRLWQLARFLEDWDRLTTMWRRKVVLIGRDILDALPASAFVRESTASDAGESSQPLSVPLIDLCAAPAATIERMIAPIYDDDIVGAQLFCALRERLEMNLCGASGINYDERHDAKKTVVVPTAYRAQSNDELVDLYLAATPFHHLFRRAVRFVIPNQSRFEHTHIVAGSGHGKTQTLQHLLSGDLTRTDQPALVVIDSQGDLIHKISHLSLFEPGSGELGSKLVIIDPTDVLHPPALNMFDVKQERLGRYDLAAREQILNGVIELYDYMFNSLLGAELTQKQSVIFRYLARLMLTVPGATIHDLLNLMTDVGPYEAHIQELSPGARAFFEMEFADRSFSQTKRQIQRRLWGILENPTFERMLTAPVNRVDMFDALNSGQVVLVNTAKDFLKAERSSLLGRFFIALTLQATLERAALPEEKRRPAFLYIDEAADYFDGNIDDLLTQARKYNLGLVFAHQYLDQLAPGLRASIAANTSIKLAGGVSTADARSLAPDMRAQPEFILNRQKSHHATSFACFVRNLTPQAIPLTVPFGVLEQQPRMPESAFDNLLEENRSRVTVPPDSRQSRIVAKPATSPRSPKPSPTAVEPKREGTTSAPQRPDGDPSPLALPEPPAGPMPASGTARRPKPPRAEPKELGVGGRQHKYLQHLLKGAAQERGYLAVLEAPVLDGAGKVDLSLTKNGRRIACEISVTTSKGWELGNLEKCLAAGYDEVILVMRDERQLKAMSKHLREQLDERTRERARCCTPDEVIAYLDELDSGAPPSEETVRGYKVKVTRSRIDLREVKERRQAIAEVLARSLRDPRKP
jgi:Type IV secretion-system coupling protein DNA-binding domain